MTKNKRKRLLVWVLFVCCFSTSLNLCRRNGHLVRGQGIVKVYKTGGLLPSLAGAWRRHHKWLQTWSRGPIWKAKTLLLLEKIWKIFVAGYKKCSRFPFRAPTVDVGYVPNAKYLAHIPHQTQKIGLCPYRCKFAMVRIDVVN